MIYYPALDGLRGIAILFTVVYHNVYLHDYFFFGWMGVDLFFVLSGYLITSILLETRGKKGYLKKFYIRRILRIFPLYYLTLIIIILILPNIPHLPVNLDYYIHYQFWFWIFLQNWLFIFTQATSTIVLHDLWSLAMEEQFYLLLPFVLLLIKKPAHLLISITAVLVLTNAGRFFIYSCDIKSLAYSNLYTFSRIDGLCAGCLLAIIQKTNAGFLKKYMGFIIAGVCFANLSFYLFNRYNHFVYPYLASVGYTSIAIFLALLVNMATTGKIKLVNLFLTMPPLKFLGRISYALYIFHWPVYILLNPLITRLIEQTLKITGLLYEILSSVIITLVALAMSILSYYTIESYFFRLKRKFT